MEYGKNEKRMVNVEWSTVAIECVLSNNWVELMFCLREQQIAQIINIMWDLWRPFALRLCGNGQLLVNFSRLSFLKAIVYNAYNTGAGSGSGPAADQPWLQADPPGRRTKAQSCREWPGRALKAPNCGQNKQKACRYKILGLFTLTSDLLVNDCRMSCGTTSHVQDVGFAAN